MLSFFREGLPVFGGGGGAEVVGIGAGGRGAGGSNAMTRLGSTGWLGSLVAASSVWSDSVGGASGGSGIAASAVGGLGAAASTVGGLGAAASSVCGLGAAASAVCGLGAAASAVCGLGAAASTVCGLGAAASTVCGLGAAASTVGGSGALRGMVLSSFGCWGSGFTWSLNGLGAGGNDFGALGERSRVLPTLGGAGAGAAGSCLGGAGAEMRLNEAARAKVPFLEPLRTCRKLGGRKLGSQVGT